MPKISKRGAEVPASPIRKLVPFAEAAKEKGRHVYHLNIGQPDIETPKGALDAVTQHGSHRDRVQPLGRICQLPGETGKVLPEE